jgi:hypothetical protein
MSAPTPSAHTAARARLARDIKIVVEYADPGDAEARARCIEALAFLLTWQPAQNGAAAATTEAAHGRAGRAR